MPGVTVRRWRPPRVKHLVVGSFVAAVLAIVAVNVIPSGAPPAVYANSPCHSTAVISNPTATPKLVEDCQALLLAEPILGGSLNWGDDVPLSDWDGVTLWTGMNRVTSLSLSNRSLDGEIPPDLGRLDELRVLSLYGNSLSGPIPPEIGNLKKLGALNLGLNDLTGSIPPELGNLTALEVLTLFHNDLSGVLPLELGNLDNLQTLNLAGNTLTGCVPRHLWDIRGDVRHLRLSRCATGTTTPVAPTPPTLPALPTVISWTPDELGPGRYHFRNGEINFIIQVPEGLTFRTGVTISVDDTPDFVFEVIGSDDLLVVDATNGEFSYLIVDDAFVNSLTGGRSSAGDTGSRSRSSDSTQPTNNRALLVQMARSSRVGTD